VLLVVHEEVEVDHLLEVLVDDLVDFEDHLLEVQVDDLDQLVAEAQ